MRVLESDMFEDYRSVPGAVLICPVNLVGVMGKGLALKFRQKYPGCELDYREALNSGNLDVGKNYIITGTLPTIMFMASKRHWRDDSRKEDIVAGLTHLRKLAKKYPAHRWLLPAVGCGEGHLSFLWLEEQCWTLLSGLDVDLYAPWAGKKR